MSDVPRRPVDPEEEELSPSAYEATVPGRMSGFRGTNPIAFVIAGVLAIGIILFAAFAFFHRSPPPDAARVAAARQQQDTQPAAPGLGGAVQTPFIPEGTPQPIQPQRPPGLQLIPVPQQQPETPPPVRPTDQPLPPPLPVQQQAIVPAPASTQVANGQMKIDQPGGSPSPGASGGGAGGDANTQYVPVYRNGVLVSVVAVSSTPSPSPSPAAAVPPSSSQFTGGQSQSGGLGDANAGLLEARKFARDSEGAPVGYVRPGSARQLTTATVLNARLMSKIESDLPGPVIAQITQPVYDSNTHTTVVVPAGTRAFGRYDEETVASSRRLLMSFSRLIFPNGEEFDIGGQPAGDSIGTAGFTGDVDTHPGNLYSSAFLLTILSGAEAALTPSQGTSILSGPSATQQIQSSAGAELSKLSNKLLDRAVDRPATIIVRPPFAFQIIVTRDLPLDEYAKQHQ